MLKCCVGVAVVVAALVVVGAVAVYGVDSWLSSSVAVVGRLLLLRDVVVAVDGVDGWLLLVGVAVAVYGVELALK